MEAIISRAATSGCGDVCVSGWECPPPPTAGIQALPPLPAGRAPKWPPGFQWLPHGARGTLSSRAQDVGSCATPLLEWNSQRSWLGMWHWNPTCFVCGISWQAGHVAVCVTPERGPEGSSWALPPGSLAPPTFALGTTGSEQP